MHVPAYCSFSYLEDITNRSVIDYIQPDDLSSGKTHFDLLELIAEGLEIRTDLSKEKIEEQRSNPYINYLIKNRRINSAANDFINLRTDADYFANLDKRVQVFLLGNTYSPLVQQFQKRSGLHVLASGDDQSCLFEEQIDTFQRGIRKTWDFAKRYLTPHHSIVIADPYIYKEASRNSIRKLYEQVIPIGLEGIYHVTLIGSDQNRKNDLPAKQRIVDWGNEIESWLSRQGLNAKIECFIYNKEDFHDRSIITNNTCVFSGYGLDIIRNGTDTQREGTWIGFKPFKRMNVNGKRGILFYDVMLEKLITFKQWIASPSENPLLNIKTTGS